MRRALFKTFLIAALLSTFALTPALTPSAQAQMGPYITANGAVYVRGGPGTGFWILGTLYRGEIVPVQGVSPDGGWWYVKASFGEGWVAGVGVTPSNTAGVGVIDPGPIGTVTAYTLRVRAGAGINAASLGVLRYGQQVFVLAQNTDGSWLQIRWAYGTGWVSAAYMSVSGVPQVSADGQGGYLPVGGEAPYAIVLSAYLNVRTGPGVNYAAIGQVQGGETLPIVGRSADSRWYQVETRFGTGWVYSGYVAARNEYGGSPVTTASAAGAEVSGPFGIVNTGALHVRSGPGGQYTSLGTIAGGTQTRIVGRNADWSWWLLETPVGTGWCSARYIIARGDTSTVPYVPAGGVAPNVPGQGGGEAPAPAIAGPVAIVSTGALNIRSGPNSAFAALGAVYAGTQLPIIGQSADRGWWKVQSDYGEGWVSKRYVVTTGSTSGVPVVQ